MYVCILKLWPVSQITYFATAFFIKATQSVLLCGDLANINSSFIVGSRSSIITSVQKPKCRICIQNTPESFCVMSYNFIRVSMEKSASHSNTAIAPMDANSQSSPQTEMEIDT